MHLPIIPVSDAERAKGVLAPESSNAGYKALHEAGVVVLRGAFQVPFIDALYSEFETRYGGQDLTGMMALSQAPFPNPIQKVGEGRFEIALRMTGPFGHI